MSVHLGNSPLNRAEHVAIIMDGSGRWAARRGYPRIFGHKAGANRLRETIKECPRLGIRYLTVFAFSTENWIRSVAEVNGLMGLFRKYIRSESADLVESGVCVRFIGDRERLPTDLVQLMENLEEVTRDQSRTFLTVALNYGGRSEIVQVAHRMAQLAVEGKLKPEEITEDLFSGFSLTFGLPDPDLVIRTSGESRISNFLLWQSAYSEFEFTDTLWPDFTPEHLREMLVRFSDRERRYGSVSG